MSRRVSFKSRRDVKRDQGNPIAMVEVQFGVRSEHGPFIGNRAMMVRFRADKVPPNLPFQSVTMEETLAEYATDWVGTETRRKAPFDVDGKVVSDGATILDEEVAVQTRFLLLVETMYPGCAVLHAGAYDPVLVIDEKRVLCAMIAPVAPQAEVLN